MNNFINNHLFSSNKKRNTIEVSNSKIFFIIDNLNNIRDNIINKEENKTFNNSFIIWNNELSKEKIIIPENIVFSKESNKFINLPLFRDKEIFRREPFNHNLIIMDNDSDIESLENSILNDKEFVLKELNYGILSYQQKKNEKMIDLTI